MINYTVVPGDTMTKIARKYGISVNDLIKANPQIINPSLIYPNQTINVPVSNTNKYTVVTGDNMWDIAKKHGVKLPELLEANHQIINKALIHPGQIINIPSSTQTPETNDNDLRLMETEVVNLVNQERARVGRAPLSENREISRVAGIKSQDFIDNNYFSHNSPVYGSPFDMLRSFNIPFTAGAENIASGQRTAAEVMNTWMNSPNHRTNILNDNYNQIGVGVARDNNGVLYWTQLFTRS